MERAARAPLAKALWVPSPGREPPRPAGAPARAAADVRVAALGEAPAVAAGETAQVQPHELLPFRRDVFGEGDVALQGDCLLEAVADAGHLSGDARGRVGAGGGT